MQSAQKPHVVASSEYQELERIILDTDVRIQLAPIISLKNKEIAGYKALAKGPVGSDFENTHDLFSAASEYGLNDELEYAVLVTALDVQHRLPEGLFLSIRVGSSLFLSKLFREITTLCQHISDQIVFELNEQVPLVELAFLEKRIQSLQEMGYRIALDVTEKGTSNIDRAKKLKPSIIKLCVDTVSRISTNNAERSQFNKAINTLDEQTVLQVERIDSIEQLSMIEALGIQLGLGTVFTD